MVETTGLCFMLIEYKLYPETDISDSIRNCTIRRDEATPLQNTSTTQPLRTITNHYA